MANFTFGTAAAIAALLAAGGASAQTTDTEASADAAAKLNAQSTVHKADETKVSEAVKAQLPSTLTKADAMSTAREQFVAADADENNALSRDEYVQLTLAEAQQIDPMLLDSELGAAETGVIGEGDASYDDDAGMDAKMDHEMGHEMNDSAAASSMATGKASTNDTFGKKLKGALTGAGDAIKTGAEKSVDAVADATDGVSGAMAKVEDKAEVQFDTIADKDGKLSQKALLKAREANFAQADADGDGVLKGDEVQTYALINAGVKSTA